jgi:D-ornithine---citrate ligase
VLRDLPGTITAAPTSALRTVLLEPDTAGLRRYVKVSLDIQVTSTRRSISIASTRNGPSITRLLEALSDGEDRLILMPETAGAAMATGRDVAAIVRGGLGGRTEPGEVAIPAAALPAVSPVTGRSILAEVVDRFGAARGLSTPATTFLSEYAHLLLSPVLRLLDAGVGYEAHLQNCIPVFRDGVPVRIAFRDFAGLRLCTHRHRIALWPGSVIGTDDIELVRAKAGYTALQAHLGELIARLADSHRLDEDAAWATVRHVIDGLYAEYGWDPGDHAFLTAPTMPHKALVRMRLDGDGDAYVTVRNPLHGR